VKGKRESQRIGQRKWEKRRKVFLGYATLSMLALGFLQFYSLIYTFVIFIGTITGQDTLLAVSILLALFIICYILFSKNLRTVERVDYIRDQIIHGEPLIPTISETVSKRETLLYLVLGTLAFCLVYLTYLQYIGLL